MEFALALHVLEDQAAQIDRHPDHREQRGGLRKMPHHRRAPLQHAEQIAASATISIGRLTSAAAAASPCVPRRSGGRAAPRSSRCPRGAGVEFRCGRLPARLVLRSERRRVRLGEHCRLSAAGSGGMTPSTEKSLVACRNRPPRRRTARAGPDRKAAPARLPSAVGVANQVFLHARSAPSARPRRARQAGSDRWSRRSGRRSASRCGAVTGAVETAADSNR